MTTYYVGSGGNDANAGTSWGARKLTLTGAEDIPVAAGDTVYVAPGVYREMLTLDVSGSVGSPITYIADVTGQNTDGVGGYVLITASDNDQTQNGTRTYCISGSTARNYRTFRGFWFEFGTPMVYNNGGTNWIIEDCAARSTNGGAPIQIAGSTQANCTIRRCYFVGQYNSWAIQFTHSSTVDNAGHLVENCISIGHYDGVTTARVGGITIKNCSFTAPRNAGVRVGTALTAGQTVTVNNCVIWGCLTGLSGTATTEIIENYNSISFCNTARTNTNTGANSNAYPPMQMLPLLYAGLILPPRNVFELSDLSTIRAIAGTGEATDDFYGITRPATSAKNSWGAVQYDQHDRETTTVDAGSVSLKLADAGYRQFIIPVGNVSTTFTVKCYREADYTGTNPQIIIKQPGVADNTTTDAGSASAWNTLSVTLTPAASPDYVIVELRSNNTATTGNYDVFFDTFTAAAALDPNGMEYWIADRIPLPQLAETEVASGGLLTHPGMAGGING